LGATRTFFVIHWHHLERKLVLIGQYFRTKDGALQNGNQKRQ